MSLNVQAMEEDGWGVELAQLGAAGYRCVYGGEDGELPVAVFAKVEDTMVHLIHGCDFAPPDDDTAAVMIACDDFEQFATTVMGMIMERRRAQEEVLDAGE